MLLCWPSLTSPSTITGSVGALHAPVQQHPQRGRLGGAPDRRDRGAECGRRAACRAAGSALNHVLARRSGSAAWTSGGSRRPRSRARVVAQRRPGSSAPAARTCRSCTLMCVAPAGRRGRSTPAGRPPGTSRSTPASPRSRPLADQRGADDPRSVGRLGEHVVRRVQPAVRRAPARVPPCSTAPGGRPRRRRAIGQLRRRSRPPCASNSAWVHGVWPGFIGCPGAAGCRG